jgi:metallo-beta-lactamase family protein
VRAQIVTLGGFSAHADQSALLAWLEHLRTAPEQFFIVHGEEEIANAFAAAIDAQLHWPTRIPAHGETIRL